MSSASERAKAELQRAMAQRLIRELRSADGMESFRYGPDGKRLTEYHFVPEQIRWIADVFERALNGDPDPLRLRPRGRKSEYPLRRLEAAAALAVLLHRNGCAMEEARAQAAEAFNVSAETVRDAMADELIRQRAQVIVEAALFWAEEQRRAAADIIREHAARQ